MVEIEGKDIPREHSYFRSHSPSYRRYLELCGLKTFSVGKDTFGWIKDFFGLFNVARMERTYEAPDLDLLRANGFKRGMVVWVPAHRKEIPTGWRKAFLRLHFMRTGFTSISKDEDYMKHWNSRAKRSRKKFLAVEGAEIREIDMNAFVEAFRKTRVRHWFKSDFITFYKKLTTIDPSLVRSWVCYYQGEIVAGLAVHDHGGHSSAHFVAFTSKKAKKIQAGTGLIDRWFADSQRIGIQFLNFDHLRDEAMASDQQGYTDFKKNFMQYLVNFPHAYFRLVGKNTEKF